MGHSSGPPDLLCKTTGHSRTCQEFGSIAQDIAADSEGMHFLMAAGRISHPSTTSRTSLRFMSNQHPHRPLPNLRFGRSRFRMRHCSSYKEING